MHERALALLELVVLGPLEHRGEMFEAGRRGDRAPRLRVHGRKRVPVARLIATSMNANRISAHASPGIVIAMSVPILDTVPIAVPRPTLPILSCGDGTHE